MNAPLTETISTPLTKLFGIQHPILLAGMNVAAGPELAAAVTNAGGMGVIGGVGNVTKKTSPLLQFYRRVNLVFIQATPPNF